jgi:hypothetical protein
MELLKIIFERAGALNGYWNLYIAVAFGVLTLMASGKSFTKHRSTKLFLTLAFICFALSNLQVLYDTNVQRGILISLAVPPYVEAATHAGPPGHWLLFLFHGALDIIVVLCIWLVPWHSDSGSEDRA